MKNLITYLLLTALFAIVGCTNSVRYSVTDEAARRTAPREPIGDTTRIDDYDSPTNERDTRVEDDRRDDREPAEDERLPVVTGSQIDKAMMNRIISRYLGAPYEKGGSGKLGLDCSGLAFVVYRDYDGTRLPLSVEALYRLDDRIGYDELAYGDLLFFRIDDRRVSHVGIYLENGRFVHSSETRGVVIDDIADEYFATRFAGARRVRL